MVGPRLLRAEEARCSTDFTTLAHVSTTEDALASVVTVRRSAEVVIRTKAIALETASGPAVGKLDAILLGQAARPQVGSQRRQWRHVCVRAHGSLNVCMCTCVCVNSRSQEEAVAAAGVEYTHDV